MILLWLWGHSRGYVTIEGIYLGKCTSDTWIDRYEEPEAFRLSRVWTNQRLLIRVSAHTKVGIPFGLSTGQVSRETIGSRAGISH